ncbi:unnamed protein product [Heligmosomoides polygyrus]|uniref:CAP-Gly domain-containing protein n=1 Tax=Heligmosomoides polygyrus TaxID=6339 RepID=A0A3P8A4G4_HELPZ|nr:unnamed protein product [Heligmosomoides polygyrus]
MQRADSRESVLSLTSCVSGVGSWQVGDRARIDQRSGTVAYVGPTKFAPGEWIGLVLDEPFGKNDGSVQGYRYFSCNPDHGLFCKSSKLDRILLSPARFKSPTPGEGDVKSPYAAEFGFDIGDRVLVSGGKQGVVRFLGETEFAQGIWAGIELEQPLGKNDGSVQGKRYFTCKTPYGVFVPASKTQKAPSQTPHRLKYQNHNYSSRGSDNAAIKALQDALQEKERHVEQLMRERDMERSEISHPGNDDQAAKISRLESERRAMKTELLAKDKIIEDLNFRLEEEVISKDCQLEELKKEMATSAGGEESLDTHAALNSEIASLKHELALVREENEKHQQLLEAEKIYREGKEKLLDAIRTELEAAKEQLLAESTTRGSELQEAKAAAEEKTRLLEVAENSRQVMQKELEKTKVELETALKKAEEQKKMVENLTSNKESSDTVLKQRLTTIEKELEDKIKETQTIAEEKKSLEDAVKDMEKQIGETKEAIEAVRQEKTSAEATLETLKSEKTSAEELLAEEKKRGETIINEHLQRIKELTAEKEATEAALSAAKASSDCLLVEKGELETRLTAVMENSDGASKDAEQRCLTLEKKLKEAEAEHSAALSAAQSKHEELSEKCSDLEAKLASMEKNLMEEKELFNSKEKALLEELASQAAKWKTEEQDLMAKLEKERAALEQITSEKSDMEKALQDAVEELKRTKEEVQQLNDKEKALQEELSKNTAKWKADEKELMEQLEKQRAAIESVTSEKSGIEERMRDTEEELKKANEDIQKLNDKAKAIQDEMASQAAKWRTAEQELLETLEKERETLNASTSEKNRLEKMTQDIEQELTRAKEDSQKLTEKLDAVTKQRQAVEDEKADVEEQLRRQVSAFTTLQSSVNASSLDQSALAKELSSATTLCAERLEEVTRLQGVVKSLEDKVHSLESTSSELSGKLNAEEERFKKSIKEKDDAIKELQQSLVQETTMRSKIEKDVRVKSDEITTLQRSIEQLTASSAENAAVLFKVRSELSAMEAEMETARKEREAVVLEKESGQNELAAMSTRVRELEEKLVESQKAMEEECKKKMGDYEAHDAKLQEELSAANEKNAQETTMRSKIEKDVRVKSDEIATLQRSIEQLTASSAENAALLFKVRSELSTMEAEMEAARKERDAAMLEKESGQNELEAMSIRVRELEEKLVESQKAMEEECKKKVSDYEVQDAKLQEELSAANEKNAQVGDLAKVGDTLKQRCDVQESAYCARDARRGLVLSSEVKLNVEELARLSQQLEETKSRADDATQIKENLEQLQSQHKQLEEELTRVTSEKDELRCELSAFIGVFQLKTLSTAQLKEGETVQVLNKELAAATSLNAEYLKEKEG